MPAKHSFTHSASFIVLHGISHRWDLNLRTFTLGDSRRRLSATVRPVFVFGEQDDDKILFGAGALSLDVDTCWKGQSVGICRKIFSNRMR